jgi:hypothetical protein
MTCGDRETHIAEVITHEKNVARGDFNKALRDDARKNSEAKGALQFRI